jgi:uncharacterized protein (TIGR02569 family)
VASVHLPADVAASFGVPTEAISLGGTERRTFLAGDLVMRQLADDPIAHAQAAWLADTLDRIEERGFRIERPVRARDGRWIVGGWTAWSRLEGRRAAVADAAQIPAAAIALHQALSDAPCPAELLCPPGLAERVAWFGEPFDVEPDPRVIASLDRLLALRRPVTGLRDQVVHGDLNYNNILVAPEMPPAFVDMTGPYLRPPEFAVAVAAYWLGPYKGQDAVLAHVAGVRELEQMLVRVALRQLVGVVQGGDYRYVQEFIDAADEVARSVG